MADAHHSAHDDHAHDDHDDHDDHGHDDHDTPDPDEATIRTPMWLPFVGMGLLAVFAVTVFLAMGPNTATGAGADADAGAAAPTAAAH
ncbi:MAG: hypothetical protein U0269_31475 [Polyangiales bacterium]